MARHEILQFDHGRAQALLIKRSAIEGTAQYINIKALNSIQCKNGIATYLEDDTSAGPCANASHEYCLAFTCRKADTTVLYTLWGCAAINDKALCEIEAKNMTERATKKTDISCDCQFGEKGKEMGNQHFVLPPMAPIVENVTDINALKNRLECKIGLFHENGIGQIHIGFCGADAKYCFAASCKIASGVIDAWGCLPSNDYCLKVGKQCNFCKLGKKDEKHSNMNFMIPTFLKKNATRVTKGIVSSTVLAPLPEGTTTTTTTTTVSTTTISTAKTISTPSANLVTDISDEMSETTADENVSIRANIPTVLSIAFGTV
ncbi:hypothetical protein niasHT_002990 [Heterodera trifolii]|uniref:Uncharacterized protein n=1 Tax=Heterodera trifolii TaxID=157864 RepID=A0ABD2LP63_9BILA